MDDDMVLLSDSNGLFHFSKDNGRTWESQRANALAHDMIDKVIDLGDDLLLTTGHMHRGTYPQPAIRQAPAEQMAYRSEDRGANWQPISALARERNLVLCEASMVRLPDKRILALMRENSFVYEPMYACLSDDDGDTWTDPTPTPLIGHRPTLGLVDDSRLLVTYRNVAPDPGTCAWTGSLEELMSDFAVQGRHEDQTNPKLSNEGLKVVNDEGSESVVRYALRPMTDPRSARATLEARVRVDTAGPNGCGLRLGIWWYLFPDHILPEGEDQAPMAIPPDQFNTIRLEYADGTVSLFVNDTFQTQITVNRDHANTRPILFGAPYPFEDNAVSCIWESVSLTIREPCRGRDYSWQWQAQSDGFPDQWALDAILELKNDRHAAAPDFGYSGWAMLDDGTFYGVYHHGGGTDDEYEPLFSAHIQGTYFSLKDFGIE